MASSEEWQVLAKVSSSTTPLFFFFLPWAGPSIVSSLTSIKLLFSIEFLLLRPLPIALCSFQMGWFFTPLKNVDAQHQECKRANFCSICFIERLFFKSSGHSVLISTDTSRASVKLIELPVALSYGRHHSRLQFHYKFLAGLASSLK